MEIVLLIVGLLVGAAAIGLVMRGRIALAEERGRRADEVQRTALAEQLRAANNELETTKSRLAGQEQVAQFHAKEAERLGQENAQMRERANRLAVVETDLNNCEELAERLKAEVADWREKNGSLTADVNAKQMRLTELQEAERLVETLKAEVAEWREKNGSLSADVNSKQKRLNELEASVQTLSAEKDQLQNTLASSKATIAELNTTLEQERQQNQEKLALLRDAREELSNQFKALAGAILDEKTQKFTEQNEKNLKQLLDPLGEKIGDFKKQVEKCYGDEGQQRSALKQQVQMLTELNQTLSEEAKNLTLAIRGDRKAQGDWGEILLDDILERAGLIEGQHYYRQDSHENEEGQRRLLDVVIHLPQNRHLVVDSKMSLPDYRAFVNADEDDERAAALRAHLASVRRHMTGLSGKNYQALYGLSSLDFVVMFIPLEPAFMLAVTHDRELFHDGWEKNVLLVSPSTLLFVIRTIANLWNQENVKRNAQEISKRGQELYDKLSGFVESLDDVGHRIGQAQMSFEAAKKKLCDGRGNVIRQAEMLRSLGVKPTKQINPEWVSLAVDTEIDALVSETPLTLPDASSGVLNDRHAN